MPVRETPQPHQTLVEPQTLNAHLRDPKWVVVDCRFDLADPGAGRAAYQRGHIPGAHYAHLDEDLSGPRTPGAGRHPLPDPRVLAGRLASWRITEDAQVIAYDEANGAFAARLWWLLRWLGHEAVAVLNGGLRAWLRAGGPRESQLPDHAPATTPARAQTRRTMWLTSAQVEAALAGRRITLIDARAADRFAGHNETLDPIAGHVPGARNHPFPANLDADQCFLPPERLRAEWLKTLGTAPPETAVCMCGSGVTACHNLLALEIAGLTGARLYAGSWSEWITDPARPIATGS